MNRKADPLNVAASIFIGSATMTIMAAIEGPLTWERLLIMTGVAAVYLLIRVLRDPDPGLESRPAPAQEGE